MKLVDVHVHLESEQFSGILDKIISEANNAGVVRMITSSIVPDQWETSRNIAERYDSVEFALGIHPWYCKPDHIPMTDLLRTSSDRGAIAIGEIGLDAKTDHTGIDLQKKIFESQLIIAKEINLPVIIHCRGAFDDLHNCLKKIGVPEAGGVIHSFSGSLEIAETFMKHGLSFSMGGVLTYRNSSKREAVIKRIYPNHFLLETDSPDIPPVEAGRGPNVPANIRFNLRAASEILGIAEENVAETTLHNAVRIFGLEI